MIRTIGLLGVLFGLATISQAGPFSNFDNGVPSNDPRIVGWADSVVDFSRGPRTILNPGAGLASFGVAANATGPSDAVADFNQVVSLGDGGSITLSFAEPIQDLDGPDFAVFENTFEFGGEAFAELAFVEVSSDGVNFFRFDAISLTQTTTQLGAFGGLDATDINNLAGKHIAGIGTPFDLAELAGVSLQLDVDAVTQVRLIDVVGSIAPGIGSIDSQVNLINDPFPTDFASSGFDLDAVAVLRPIPEPAAAALLVVGLAVCRRRINR